MDDSPRVRKRKDTYSRNAREEKAKLGKRRAERRGEADSECPSELETGQPACFRLVPPSGEPLQAPLRLALHWRLAGFLREGRDARWLQSGSTEQPLA